MKTPQTFSISKLSEITKMDRRTIKKLLRAVDPTGGTRSRPEWTLKHLEDAGRAAVSADKGGSTLRAEKLSEEIRRLKHINDLNSDVVVEKARVCEAFTRGFHRLHEFRVELETKWPAKLVGLADVPTARAECRRMTDRIYSVFRSMGSEFAKLDGHPG